MFDLFTSDARSAVVAAHAIAREARSGEIRPLHLLAGVLEVVEAGASSIRVAPEKVARFRAMAIADRSDVGASTSFSAASKTALERTLQRALDEGSRSIGIDCLLHGVIGVIDETAAAMLSEAPDDPSVEPIEGERATIPSRGVAVVRCSDGVEVVYRDGEELWRGEVGAAELLGALDVDCAILDTTGTTGLPF